MSKGSRHSQQFKEHAVRYKKEHPELTAKQTAENLDVSLSALKHWIHDAKVNNGSVPSTGSGNYASEEAREIARLKRELRDAKDALEVLKKQSVSWENDTEHLYCCIQIYSRNTAAFWETPCLCQRDTAASGCFTFRLLCMSIPGHFPSPVRR